MGLEAFYAQNYIVLGGELVELSYSRNGLGNGTIVSVEQLRT